MNDLTLSIKFTTAGGQTVVKSVESLADAVKDANQQLKGTQGAGQQAQQGFNQAASGSKKLNNEVTGASAEMARLRTHMHSMVGVGAAFYTALAAGAKVREYAYLADDFNVLQQRIKTATADTGDYNEVSSEMYAIAQRNGAALQPTVELFQRLATSRKDIKATNDQMLDFTDSVQKLGVIGGSSTDAMKFGLVQLSQGLSGGIFRAEEFNSLLENIPEVAARIGKGMDDIGKADSDLGLGQLRKLVMEGKLLSEDVFKSILIQMPEIEKQFARMPISMGRASIMVDNSLSSSLSKLDGTVGLTRLWADTLVDISQTLDSMDADELNNAMSSLLAIAGGAAALVILSKYGIGLTSVAASYKGLTAWLNTYRTVQVATTATVYNAATMTNLTVTANTAAARSFDLLAVKAGLAKGALALLGGPAGLAFAAGAAIYYFASSSNDAEDEAERLKEQVKSLTSEMDNLSKVQAKPKLIEAQDSLKLKEEAAALLEIEKEKLEVGIANQAIWAKGIGDKSTKEQERYNNAVKQTADEYAVVMAALEAVGLEVEIYQERIKALQDILANGKKENSAPTGDPEGTKALNDELLKLYNTQMLNAQAIDAQGRALVGVDFDLFKTQFKGISTLPVEATAAIKQFAEQAKAANANLGADAYLKQLKDEIALLDVKLSKGDDEFELQKRLAQYVGANPARLNALKTELQLMQKKQAALSDKDTLKNIKQETDLLRIRLNQGEKEYEVQKALFQLKGGDPAVIAAIEAEVRAQQELNEQLDVRKHLTDGTYDDVLDGLTKIGEVGGAAGNALVDAFGSVADQFANMAEQQDEFTKKFLELSEARKLAEKETNPALRTKALEKADAVERSLMEDQFRMQVGGYATLTNAAGKMFSENSKGRQVLHRMETTFAAIETALALKKAAANALTAITNQGGGDPYSAFARIAAMAALMAGLGVFSGSTSSGTSATSRQDSQGTGTVLGDSSAKSESIANSLERIESLELDQYAELRSINTSIRALNAGIAQLATNLVANFGRFNEDSYQGELGKEYNVQLGSGLAAGALFAPLQLAGLLDTLLFTAVDKMLGGVLGSITNKFLGGLFGSTKKELVDSGISFAAQELGDILANGLVDATLYDVIKTTKKKAFGLSKSTKENTEYRAIDEDIRAEFGRVFSYIGNSVTDAVKLLGLTTTKDLENFVIKLPNVSFKDLSGDEIEQELQAIFSQQGDLMAKYLLPGIAEFQQMGEGLYDTLIRVAQEQAVFNAGLASLGLELSRFGGVTAEVQVQVAQSLIELMGGIEEFSSATSDYFAAFYSESEQMAYMQKVINEQFKSLNIALPGSRDGFKELVDGLDLTTDAGQAMFAALMKLVPMMDEFYDAAEEAADAAKKAAEEEKKLNAERKKYNANVKSDIARMGMSPLQIALDDINKWYADATAEARALGADTSLLTTLYNKKREALATEYVSKSIQSAETAMASLVADYQRSVEQLGQTLASVLDSIAGMSDTIRGDILNIRKTLPEFDSVVYYNGEVANLSAQLGTGTATAQLDIIGKLKAAMLERYNAELAAIGTNMDALQSEQDAKQELYDTQLEQFQALKDAALGLKAAAASLLYSDLSTLTAGQRLQQLQSQYNTAVTKARGGDAQAYAQVQDLGEQLLQMSRDYNPAAYSSVFDSVLAVFNELGSNTFAEPTAPAPHPAVAAFEAEKIALARQTIAQLEALTGRTESLNAVANAEYTAAVNALKTQFTADATAITATLQTELAAVRAVMPRETDRVIAKLQESIDAIYNMRDGVIGAVKAPPPVTDVIVKNPVVLPPELIGIGKPIYDILPLLPPYMRDIQTSVRDGTVRTGTILNEVRDRLHSSNQSLELIARADFVAKPLIIPPAQVSVNVDMVSVVNELRAVQQKQQLQLEQQTAIAKATTDKLAEVVATNKQISVELGDFGGQVIAQARIA